MKDLQKTILDLSERFKDASKEEVIAELAKVTADADSAKAEVEESTKDLAILNEKLSAFESGKKVKATHPTVKIGKDVYEIVNPTVKVKGTVYTAQQIRENKLLVVGDEKIADYLLKIGSGVLVLKTA